MVFIQHKKKSEILNHFTFLETVYYYEENISKQIEILYLNF